MTREEAIDIAVSALRPVSREQVEKVWRGKWKYSHTSEIDHFAVVKCSKCGYEAFAISLFVKDGNFCPSCGAPHPGQKCREKRPLFPQKINCPSKLLPSLQWWQRCFRIFLANSSALIIFQYLQSLHHHLHSLVRHGSAAGRTEILVGRLNEALKDG